MALTVLAATGFHPHPVTVVIHRLSRSLHLPRIAYLEICVDAISLSITATSNPFLRRKPKNLFSLFSEKPWKHGSSSSKKAKAPEEGMIYMISSFVDKSQALLSHHFFAIVFLFIAIPLAWPLIHTGWFADDLYQRVAYIDAPGAHNDPALGEPLIGPMRMYSFFDGDPDRFQQMLDYGRIPWWCSPDIRAALWRPITAYFSMLDYWLWPESSELMHVQSLVWFTLLILLSGLVYREIMGAGWAAGLAVLLYTICDIQMVPIAFLANRHILIAAVFGIGAIGAYDRWRKQGQNGWAFVSGILFACSLLASESGIAVFGYLMSYSLWIERGNYYTRIKPLIPFILMTILWRIVYSSLGYGISGVEVYVDPGTDPLQFAYAVLIRAPMILLHTLAYPPSDITPIVMVLKLYWVLVLIVLACLGWLFFPLYRNCRLSLFWLFGALFAVVPLCSAFPGGRSLALASFGMTGFLAQILYNAVKTRNGTFHSISRRLITIIVLFGLVFLRLIVGAYNLNQGHKLLQMGQKGIERISNLDIEDPELSRQDLILVNPPITIFTWYIIPNRLLDYKPLPLHFRTLASGVESIEIKRSDNNTLIVRPSGGYMRPPNWNQVSLANLRSYTTLRNFLRYVERLFANRKDPFSLAQTIELTGVTIQISELTEDKRPAEATFIFDAALEDSSLRWLQWNNKSWQYEEFILPRVGEKVVVE